MTITTKNSVYTIDTEAKTVSGGAFTERGMDGVSLVEIPNPVVGEKCHIRTVAGIAITSQVAEFSSKGGAVA